MREKLLDLIVNNSFRYSKDASFKLASGRMSNYYIDCKKVTLNSEGILLIANLIYEQIKALNIKGIGGLTLGADPISYCASIISTQNGKPLHPFIVRKEAKGHGTGAFIEGVIKEGDEVLIVDDVITTGGSTIKAIERSRSAGFVVNRALVLVDREEGGREAIEELDVKVLSLFTRSEIFERYKTLGNDF